MDVYHLYAWNGIMTKVKYFRMSNAKLAVSCLKKEMYKNNGARTKM